MSESLKREMEFARDLVNEAGAVTLRYFQRGVETQWKEDATPVTVADVEAENLIRQRLAAEFPRDGVLGEEKGEQAGSSGRVWIVDPIDGTKSFIQGVPLYGALLALEENGEAVVGAIGLPGFDEVIFAARGEGCWWNDRRTSVSEVDALSDACIVYTSFAGFETVSPRGGAVRDQLAQSARLLRGWGDAYGYALVATGRADAMIDPTISPWDIAPMSPIMEEAGGRFSDWLGTRGSRVKNAVASNGLVHDEILAILKGGK